MKLKNFLKDKSCYIIGMVISSLAVGGLLALMKINIYQIAIAVIIPLLTIVFLILREYNLKKQFYNNGMNKEKAMFTEEKLVCTLIEQYNNILDKQCQYYNNEFSIVNKALLNLLVKQTPSVIEILLISDFINIKSDITKQDISLGKFINNLVTKYRTILIDKRIAIKLQVIVAHILTNVEMLEHVLKYILDSIISIRNTESLCISILIKENKNNTLSLYIYYNGEFIENYQDNILFFICTKIIERIGLSFKYSLLKNDMNYFNITFNMLK